MEPASLVHIKGIGDKTARMMVHRAKAFIANEAIPFANPVTPGGPVEVYFDVESIQIGGFRQEHLRYYLFGWCVRRNNAVIFDYECEMAERPDQEAEIWDRFLARIDAIPGPVFHYSNYERQTVRNLCQRYGADRRAQRLEERLVDLYPLVKSCIALPLKSYSIKSVAPWLGYKWTGITQTASDTMIEYARWLKTGNRTHLNNIITYNEHDCRAMVVVKDWLAEFNS